MFPSRNATAAFRDVVRVHTTGLSGPPPSVLRALDAFRDDADPIDVQVVDDIDVSVWAHPRSHASRACLVVDSIETPAPIRFSGDPADADALVGFFNRAFGRDRTLSGDVSPLGMSRRRAARSKYVITTGDACERIDAADVTQETFFRDYVLRNKPVVISGAALTWPAREKWTNDFLRYVISRSSSISV